MQINRLLEIVFILLSKRSVTARELADRLSVSVRTIYRDIDTLSTSGIPIYTSKGKGGGVSILENYVIDRSMVTEDEQNQIIYALQNMSATSIENIDNVLVKLNAVFNKKDSRRVIEVDFSRWGFKKDDNEKFETIRNSAIIGEIISFYYINSYGGKGLRKVKPIKLVFKSKSWYLQGYCLLKNDHRTFKISRMFNVKKTNEFFDYEELEVPDIEVMTNFGSRYESDIAVNFSKDMAFMVYEEFFEEDIRKNEDGSFTVSMSNYEDGWLLGFILSCGTHAKIIKPKCLIEDMKKMLKEIYNMYE